MQFFYPITRFQPTRRIMWSTRQPRLESVFERCLDRVISDWRNYIGYIPNEHPLVVAIKNQFSATEDFNRIYLNAQAQADQIAGTMKWFGGTSKGAFLSKPYFFGDEVTPEMIISVNREESNRLARQQYLDDEMEYWQNWTPIRVKLHNYTDMDYEILSQPTNAYQARIPMQTKSINIIEVDLPLLYLQYRYWLQSEDSWLDGTKMGIAQFLLRYPLANCIESQMKLAYFNRICCLWRGETIKGNRQLHRRHVSIGTYQEVDLSILEVMERYKKYGGMNFERFVSNLPTLTSDYQAETLFSLPETTLSLYTESALMMSVLPLYEIWWGYIKTTQQQKWNTETITTLKRALRFIMNKQLFAVIPDAHNQIIKARVVGFNKALQGD